MRARDQVGVADVLQRTLEAAGDAGLRQAVGHLERALAPAAARGGQAGLQRRIVGIEAQADDVHGDADEADRDLGAGEVGQAQRQRGVARALLAADLVVVGERPELHAVGLRACCQGFRRERAVGNGGVAVQVGVHPGTRQHRVIDCRERAGFALSAARRPKGRRAGCARRCRRSAGTARRRAPGARRGNARPWMRTAFRARSRCRPSSSGATRPCRPASP